MSIRKRTPQNVVRGRQLADALQLVGRANHYMVGIVVDYTEEEMDDAEQILITKQNALKSNKGKTWHELERALNLIDDERHKRRRAASVPVRQAASFHGDVLPDPNAPEPDLGDG